MRRMLAVMNLDLARHLRRPSIWSLVAVIALITWSLSTGDAKLGTGTAFVGGKRAWITSEFSTAFAVIVLSSTLYAFYVVIVSGLSMIREHDLKIGDLLHATPLRPVEYVWGKFAALLITFSLVLGMHLSLAILFNHVIPNSEVEQIYGPLRLLDYLRPALVFAMPTLCFFAGVSFWAGERWRKASLVYLLPIGLIMTMFGLLWNWSPDWLAPGINRALMLGDPSGFRWLNETWLKQDRGVDFYNTARIGLDLGFVLSRLALAGLGLGFVALTARRFARAIRGAEAPGARPVAAATVFQPAPVTSGPLQDLHMRTRAPGFLHGVVQTMRFELSSLLREPLLYVFGLFIMLEAVLIALLRDGAFHTPMLMTSGTFAVSTMNTLSLLICLLLMFYTVESIDREKGSGLTGIAYSTPLSSAAMLTGKALSSAAAGLMILVAHLLAAWATLAIQGQVAFEFGPFGMIYGLLLVPTFLAWTTFVVAVRAISGQRTLTYSLCLGAIALTLYHQLSGGLTWVSNWMMWGSVQWTDMGALQLHFRAILLNRLLVLGLALLFGAIAIRAMRRRDIDLSGLLVQMRPGNLLRGTLRLAPYAAVSLVAGAFLWVGVQGGYQGARAEAAEKDYWSRNLNTWRDAPDPSVRFVDLDVRIEPDQRSFHTAGSYTLANDLQGPLARFALSGGLHWRDLSWTLNGEPFEPENRSSLYVFQLAAPLEPGQEAVVGFEFHGQVHGGMSKNGGESWEFILPAGVVLNTFQPTFAPGVGYDETRGVFEDNRTNSQDFQEGFHEEILPPVLGSVQAFHTRITITTPEAYRANSVGVMTDESVAGGRRTVTWETDHPVRMFNIVAGKWDVHRGQGTEVYYHPEHDYNVAEIGEVLDASRKYYSEWFHPYPWKELKLSQFPGLASYAAGWPTNITFSEGLGFLTRGDVRNDSVLMVTAHEAAHQWWGNIVSAGEGPGAGALQEGMAHFSTLLLAEQLRGERSRMAMARAFETTYNEGRRVDAERPLVQTDGSRAGDFVLRYEKAGWVYWMLQDLMGRDAALAGIRAYVEKFKDGPDYPGLPDFLACLRPFAPDPDRFDAFARQWFHEIVLPEYRLSEPQLTQHGGDFEIVLDVENHGSGRMPVEIAAVRGERFDEEDRIRDDYRESRQTVVLGPGEVRRVTIRAGFEPERVLADPDIRVLQFRRQAAVLDL